MRAIITGQVGVHKKPLIAEVERLAQRRGKSLAVCHVGDMMYAEAPDVQPGRILDLTRERLDALRRSVFKDILRLAEREENVLVNTHACFRWRHGLFPAFDHDQIKALDPDLYLTVAANVDAVHARIGQDHDLAHKLRDILVWREEEVFTTEILARIIRGHGRFFLIARDMAQSTAEMIYRLMFEPERRKVYPSFPMTHVMDLPDVLEEIRQFREALGADFIVFDPADLNEQRLLFQASAALRQGERSFTVGVEGEPLTLSVEEVSAIADDIEAQTYARDFRLIDQSDMIVSYIPELPNGKPALSSGVERELQHAYEKAREVYVIWKPKADPSIFVTKTAHKVFKSLEECLDYFAERGYARRKAQRSPVEPAPSDTLPFGG